MSAEPAARAPRTPDFVPSAPLVLNWALSNRCNFRCQHCYSRTEAHDDLDTDVLKGLLARVAAAGVLSVQLGGGEPLLHPDLLELVAAATAAGLAVSLNSNGSLLDAAAARALAAAGIRKVGISIDSADPGVHDAFRGTPGSHAKAVAALGHLREAGVETGVSAVICRINVDAFTPLVDLAIAAGAGSINFHDFKCSGLGYAHRDALDLAPDEWRRFYEQALRLRTERAEAIRVQIEDPVTALLGHKDAGSLVKGSVCGKLSLAIKANGDVTPCGFIPVTLGNLVRDDLLAIWSASPFLAAMRHKEAHGKCVGCDAFATCVGGCSARALALTGDLANPDPHCWRADD